MRHARVITLFPEESQSTLAFSSSFLSSRHRPPASASKRGQGKTKAAKAKPAPASSKVTATSSVPPISPTNEARYHQCSRPPTPSKESRSTLPHLPHPPIPVISLLSEDEWDQELPDQNMLESVDSIDVPSSAPEAGDQLSAPPTWTIALKTDDASHNESKEEDDTEDDDQIAWSDEDNRPEVPAHVLRARKSKAVSAARKRRQTQAPRVPKRRRKSSTQKEKQLRSSYDTTDLATFDGHVHSAGLSTRPGRRVRTLDNLPLFPDGEVIDLVSGDSAGSDAEDYGPLLYLK